jgi:hypothetical protein
MTDSSRRDRAFEIGRIPRHLLPFVASGHVPLAACTSESNRGGSPSGAPDNDGRPDGGAGDVEVELLAMFMSRKQWPCSNTVAKADATEQP